MYRFEPGAGDIMGKNLYLFLLLLTPSAWGKVWERMNIAVEKGVCYRGLVGVLRDVGLVLEKLQCCDSKA